MPEDIPRPAQTGDQPRLGFLRALCILSFTGSGAGAFVFAFITAFYTLFKQQSDLTLQGAELEMMQQLLSAGRWFFAAGSILYTASLLGAILMWRLRRNGFHLYTTAQILLLLLPMVMIRGYQVPSMNIWLSVAFVFGYANYLRFMR
jgi:hypothetical protein